jgi:hypothetical protein
MVFPPILPSLLLLASSDIPDVSFCFVPGVPAMAVVSANAAFLLLMLPLLPLVFFPTFLGVSDAPDVSAIVSLHSVTHTVVL